MLVMFEGPATSLLCRSALTRPAPAKRSIGRYKCVSGAYLPDKSLYPEEWQGAGAWKEFSVFTRCSLPVIFALMAIITIWAKTLL